MITIEKHSMKPFLPLMQLFSLTTLLNYKKILSKNHDIFSDHPFRGAIMLELCLRLLLELSFLFIDFFNFFCKDQMAFLNKSKFTKFKSIFKALIHPLLLLFSKHQAIDYLFFSSFQLTSSLIPDFIVYINCKLLQMFNHFMKLIYLLMSLTQQIS